MPNFSSGDLQTPTFETGNANWNTALSTLGGALFGGAGRQAQQYYYGSEARKAQLESNQLTDKQRMENYLLANTPGSGIQPAPFQFAQPGLPNSPAILAEPKTLPYAPGQGPTPAQPSQGAPAPSQGDGTPIVSPVGSPGAPAPPTTIPPTTLGQVLAPGSAPFPKGVLQAGTPPQADSPAPGSGAPAAPNITTSDAQPPPNNAGDGPIHPGSVTDANGGRKQSGPAGPNGSPPNLAFNPNLLVVMLQRAGYDANSIREQLQAYVASAYRSGVLDKQTATQMDAMLGQGKILAEQEAYRRQQLVAQTELKKQAMVTDEAESQFIRTPQLQQGVGPDGGPVTAYPPPKGQAPQPGQPVFNQDIYSKGRELVPVIMPDGKTLTQVTRQEYTSKPPGTYGYLSPSMMTEGDKQINVYARKPDGTVDYTRVVPSTVRQAIANKDELPPTSVEELKGRGGGGMLATPENKSLGQAVTGAVGATTTPTQLTPTEDFQRHTSQLRQVVQNYYQGSPAIKARNLPARLDGPEETELRSRADQIYRSTPGLQSTGNYTAAVDQALNSMQRDGVLPTNDQVTQGRGYDITGTRNVIQETDETGRPREVFRIDPLKRSSLGSVVGGGGGGGGGSGTTAQPAQGQDLGPAPEGVPEGQPVRNKTTGQMGVVQNGRIIAAPTAAQGGGG